MRTSRRFQLAILAMAAFGTFSVLFGFLGEWYWFADLFAHPRAQYFLWLGVALLAAIYARQRLAMWIAVIGLCINAAVLARYGLPWKNEPNEKGRGAAMTVVSINLLYGNRDSASVCGYLRTAKPDVVVFQEFGPFWATALEQLADDYPYRSGVPRKDGFGIAVFSKEKPAGVEIREVGQRVGDYAVFANWGRDGRRINIVGVHPDKPDAEWKTKNRATYLSNIAQWCRAKANVDEPVVVLGDFNATPWSASLRRLCDDTGLRNTNQGVIFGATWNVYQPQRLLIDHAFVSPHWDLLHREVGPDIGSDHRPLLVRVALRKR